MKSMCCLRDLVEDRGLGGRRRDRVDGDVVAGEFLAERLRQRDHAGLRRRIVRGVRIAFLAGDRGDVDDPPVLLLRSSSARRPCEQMKGPSRLMRMTRRHSSTVVSQVVRVGARDAGIVDQDVDLAERLRASRRARPRPGRARSRRSRNTFAAVADLLRRLLGERDVAIPDRDLRARRDEALGDRRGRCPARRRSRRRRGPSRSMLFMDHGAPWVCIVIQVRESARRDFGDLFGRQCANAFAAQHQEEPRGFLEFLDRVGRGRQATVPATTGP